MLAIELTFKNTSESPLSNITIGDTRLQSGMSMRDTNGINQLGAGNSATLTVGINFNDTLQPAKFDIWYVMNRSACLLYQEYILLVISIAISWEYLYLSSLYYVVLDQTKSSLSRLTLRLESWSEQWIWQRPASPVYKVKNPLPYSSSNTCHTHVHVGVARISREGCKFAGHTLFVDMPTNN